jgi:hypothetical protein
MSRKKAEGDGLKCSFCNKSQRDVRKLIAGPTVYICDECIGLCNDIIAEEIEKETESFGFSGASGNSPTVTRKLCGDSRSANCLVLPMAEGITISIGERLPIIANHPSRRENKMGNGLGLWICKRVMKLHGGNILVSSVEGQGSCFTLWLPPEKIL